MAVTWRQAAYQHAKPVGITVGELQQLAVNAQYTNTYATLHGILITRWSDFWPPVKAPVQQSHPVLDQWSDATYLEWMKQKNTQRPLNSPLKPLSFIVITNVHKLSEAQDKGRFTNLVVDIIFDSVCLAYGHGTFGWDHRLVFSKQQRGNLLNMVLGTYPGHLVTELLTRHKQTLGARSVKSVSVWTNPTSPQVPLNRETVKLKKTNPAIHRRADVDVTLRRQGYSNRCMMEAQPDQIKGEQPQRTAENSQKELKEHGWYRRVGSQPTIDRCVAGLPPRGTAAKAWPEDVGLGLASPPVMAVVWVYVEGTEESTDKILAKKRNKMKIDASYGNAYDTENGVLVSVWDSYGPFQGDPLQGDSQRPPISKWSDITFIEWDTLRSLQQSDVREQLNFLVVTGIVMPYRNNHKGGREVVENVWRILRKRNKPQAPAWNYKITLEKSNQADPEDFHMHLGTTQGNMITHLLTQYQTALGHREVESITFYADNKHARDRVDPETSSISMVFEMKGSKGEWAPKSLPAGQPPLSVPDNSDESAWTSRAGSPEPEFSVREGSSSSAGRQAQAGGGH